MHELSIMEGAMRQVLDAAQQAGASRVLEIRLRIGALSSVVPESLRFAFEAVAEGTMAQQARLVIEPVPARFWCESCRVEFESNRLLAVCPRCDTLSRELRSGREMELASVEVE
jgi:hydrogenase nickel incorporation protein HypA/HybF